MSEKQQQDKENTSDTNNEEDEDQGELEETFDVLRAFAEVAVTVSERNPAHENFESDLIDEILVALDQKSHQTRSLQYSPSRSREVNVPPSPNASECYEKWFQDSRTTQEALDFQKQYCNRENSEASKLSVSWQSHDNTQGTLDDKNKYYFDRDDPLNANWSTPSQSCDSTQEILNSKGKYYFDRENPHNGKPSTFTQSCDSTQRALDDSNNFYYDQANPMRPASLQLEEVTIEVVDDSNIYYHNQENPYNPVESPPWVDPDVTIELVDNSNPYNINQENPVEPVPSSSWQSRVAEHKVTDDSNKYYISQKNLHSEEQSTSWHSENVSQEVPSYPSGYYNQENVYEPQPSTSWQTQEISDHSNRFCLSRRNAHDREQSTSRQSHGAASNIAQAGLNPRTRYFLNRENPQAPNPSFSWQSHAGTQEVSDSEKSHLNQENACSSSSWESHDDVLYGTQGILDSETRNLTEQITLPTHPSGSWRLFLGTQRDTEILPPDTRNLNQDNTPALNPSSSWQSHDGTRYDTQAFEQEPRNLTQDNVSYLGPSTSWQSHDDTQHGEQRSVGQETRDSTQDQNPSDRNLSKFRQSHAGVQESINNQIKRYFHRHNDKSCDPKPSISTSTTTQVRDNVPKTLLAKKSPISQMKKIKSSPTSFAGTPYAIKVPNDTYFPPLAPFPDKESVTSHLDVEMKEKTMSILLEENMNLYKRRSQSSRKQDENDSGKRSQSKRSSSYDTNSRNNDSNRVSQETTLSTNGEEDVAALFSRIDYYQGENSAASSSESTGTPQSCNSTQDPATLRNPDNPQTSTCWQSDTASALEQQTSTLTMSLKMQVLDDADTPPRPPRVRRPRLNPIVDVKRVEEERQRRKAKELAEKEKADSSSDEDSETDSETDSDSEVDSEPEKEDFKKPILYSCNRCNRKFFHIIPFRKHMAHARRHKKCQKRRRR